MDVSGTVFTDLNAVANITEESTLLSLNSVEHRDTSGNVIGKPYTSETLHVVLILLYSRSGSIESYPTTYGEAA